jgi:deoxyadenosine/deoxycytidine kinase
VAVAGNIGSGKSSLTEGLSRLFGWRPSYELVDENPYLADFYRDMARWAFPLQVYFLSQRFRHHQDLVRAGEPVVQDRTIYEDAEIFARNLHERGLMSARDYESYRELFAVMTEFLRPPDLVVLLRAPVPTLRERIARRGREFERGIPEDYLARLNELYDDWAARWTASPILALDSAPLDFAHDPAALEDVAARVRAALPGRVPEPAAARR